ncbi:alpha/beta fold hydrolase [Salinisphaera orenii]|uniref:Poly(3-hydroxyalkanoate) depolymerase PhaB n=1 Tax=Salinisphaera orenii YIM 95161 TaxID=1051139 RepID=A0A423Q8X0_9GAMM|nr:alpha/beta hydrolase [Salinisphaera halophila]ROO36770.1 poly(3-hydroxyalkanoate) depolymerase PhaB [Salinisphaera halophila YIM 95161]
MSASADRDHDPFTHATVAVDGERLHVAQRDGRGTPLLFCNDFAANLEILGDVARHLEQPVIAFDPPGVGASEDVHRMRRMAALARLVVAMLDRVGVETAVDVLGIGWGGLLAQQIARQAPDRVRRLVLAATCSGQLMFPGRFNSLWRLAHPKGLTRIAPDAARARSVFGGRRTDECRAIARAMGRATPPTRRGHAAQLYALAGYSSLPWLHRLGVPTLVLAGDDDAVVPMVNARVLALLLPRARLTVIRGGGHWFVLERTDEVVRELDGFLNARHAPRPPAEDNTL